MGTALFASLFCPWFVGRLTPGSRVWLPIAVILSSAAAFLLGLWDSKAAIGGEVRTTIRWASHEPNVGRVIGYCIQQLVGMFSRPSHVILVLCLATMRALMLMIGWWADPRPWMVFAGTVSVVLVAVGGMILVGELAGFSYYYDWLPACAMRLSRRALSASAIGSAGVA